MLESDGGKGQGIRRGITTSWHVMPLGSNTDERVLSPLMVMMVKMMFCHHLLCFH